MQQLMKIMSWMLRWITLLFRLIIWGRLGGKGQRSKLSYNGWNKRLAASTIIESITALLILGISFTAGTHIFLQVLQSDALPVKSEAWQVLNLVEKETIEYGLFFDETIEKPPFVIERKLLPYSKGGNTSTTLQQLQLRLWEEKHQLELELNCLVHVRQ